ncbi:MAG: hypothetical protein ACOZF2_04255 [Thermodesulfobacteriota bacterium]
MAVRGGAAVIGAGLTRGRTHHRRASHTRSGHHAAGLGRGSGHRRGLLTGASALTMTRSRSAKAAHTVSSPHVARHRRRSWIHTRGLSLRGLLGAPFCL